MINYLYDFSILKKIISFDMYLVTAYIYHYIAIRLLKHNSKDDNRYISLCRLLFPYAENIADE